MPLSSVIDVLCRKDRNGHQISTDFFMLISWSFKLLILIRQHLGSARVSSLGNTKALTPENGP